MTTPTNAELLLRMRDFEDHFIERKTAGDSKDLLKTLVAFGNSTPIDQYSVLYIGVRDSGEIETPQPNLDKFQRRVTKELEEVYPRLACTQVVLAEDGRQALAIVVPHSLRRTHFAGPSYIRSGSQSLVASEEQFLELIETRGSKVAHILRYKGEYVHVINSLKTPHGASESYWGGNPRVTACNTHYITITEGTNTAQTFPMSQIDIGMEYSLNRLKIIIYR